MVQILQRILRRAQVGARVGELARERLAFWVEANDGSLRNFRRESVGIEISFEQIL